MVARLLGAVLLILCLVSPAFAASLFWDYHEAPVPATVDIERSDAPSGPFEKVATVPGTPATFSITPGLWGYYRVQAPNFLTNIVNYSADVQVGTTPPPPVSTIIIKTINERQVEISCANGTRPAQGLDGSGLKRIVECVP